MRLIYESPIQSVFLPPAKGIFCAVGIQRHCVLIDNVYTAFRFSKNLFSAQESEFLSGPLIECLKPLGESI